MSYQSLGEFVSQVRQYLRDYPELNRLIDGEETSDRMIAWSVIDALDDINNTPPLIGTFTIETFPYRHLLMRGTVLAVLESVGLLQTRNQISYSDGGISVNASDKAPMIMNWINMLRGQYEQKKQQYKIAVNISEAFDGDAVLSDYYFLGGYYDVFDRIYR
ncbi:MAG: hypothetical protein ACO32I_02760 [Candidatus Limnocylindrus sp.]